MLKRIFWTSTPAREAQTAETRPASAVDLASLSAAIRTVVFLWASSLASGFVALAEAVKIEPATSILTLANTDNCEANG